MDETISAIDTIALRIPLDIWAPAPMSQGVPRTHVESLYLRVTTSGGVVGWGESFGTARPMVVAAFDNWIRRLAVGQRASDEELVPRIERTLLSLSRSGPLAPRLRDSTLRYGTFAGSLRVFRCRPSLAAPSERASNAMPRCFNTPASQNTSSATRLALSNAVIVTLSCMSALRKQSLSRAR